MQRFSRKEEAQCTCLFVHTPFAVVCCFHSFLLFIVFCSSFCWCVTAVYFYIFPCFVSKAIYWSSLALYLTVSLAFSG
jgi:hypothetical protein